MHRSSPGAGSGSARGRPTPPRTFARTTEREREREATAQQRSSSFSSSLLSLRVNGTSSPQGVGRGAVDQRGLGRRGLEASEKTREARRLSPLTARCQPHAELFPSLLLFKARWLTKVPEFTDCEVAGRGSSRDSDSVVVLLPFPPWFWEGGSALASLSRSLFATSSQPTFRTC